jgi:hypothetical protein
MAREGEKAKVLPWIICRRTIFDFYKFILNNYGSINGGVLSKCMAFDEFLILYFIKVIFPKS